MTRIVLRHDPKADMGTRLKAAFEPFREGGLVHSNDVYKLLNVDKQPTAQTKRTYLAVGEHMRKMGWRSIMLHGPYKSTVGAYARGNIDREIYIFIDPLDQSCVVTDELTGALSPLPPSPPPDPMLDVEDEALRKVIAKQAKRKVSPLSRDGTMPARYRYNKTPKVKAI